MDFRVFQQATDQHWLMLEKIHNALSHYLDNQPFKHLVVGSQPLKRAGEKRLVHFVELTDSSKVTIRLEVFVKSVPANEEVADV